MNFFKSKKPKKNNNINKLVESLNDIEIGENSDEINWENICKNKILSESFMREHKEHIKFQIISKHQTLSEGFMEEFSGKLDWVKLSENQVMSEQFVKKYENYVHWFAAVQKNLFSESFLKGLGRWINWQFISYEANFTMEYIEHYKNFLFLNIVLDFQKIDYEFVKENLILFDVELIEKRGPKYYTLEQMDELRRIRCSEEFIEKNKDKISWKNFSEREDISESVLRKFTDKLNWTKVSNRPNLSEQFIRDFKDELSWVAISSKQNLSENFIAEFSNYVNWQNIARNQQLSFKFIVSKFSKMELGDIYMNNNIKTLNQNQKNELEKLYKIKNLFRTQL
jgi:hypothetical protein